MPKFVYCLGDSTHVQCESYNITIPRLLLPCLVKYRRVISSSPFDPFVRLVSFNGSSPSNRAVLLKAKCIPPLLRVRQRLRERASASKGRNSESAICSQAKQEAKLVDKPEGHTKACEGKIGSPGNKTVAEQRVEISGVVEKQHVRSEAGPPLEAIINMVIDQVLGKTSYSLVARPEDQSS